MACLLVYSKEVRAGSQHMDHMNIYKEMLEARGWWLEREN